MFDAEEWPNLISAFVDDIGIISLDPRWLAVAKFTDREVADNPGVTVLMDRVASLEELVCHLLCRNEELRMALRESSAREMSSSAQILHGMDYPCHIASIEPQGK
jgi:hypothetical protein